MIEGYLSKIESEINSYSTDYNTEEIAEIIQETTLLKSQLGKRTQDWVAKKFSGILAKITKESPEIFKAFLKKSVSKSLPKESNIFWNTEIN